MKYNISHHVAQSKMNSLINEATQLSNEKENLLKRLSEIDVRIHQIVGAVSVLEELNQENQSLDLASSDQQSV